LKAGARRREAGLLTLRVIRLDEVAGFFSRKKPVTKSLFVYSEALGKKEVMLSLLF
jgi:hypothetical protein